MAALKRMLDMTEYFVTFRGDDGDEYVVRYMAEDAGHAGELCDQAGEGTNTVLLVETATEYDARMGAV